ncbi:MAG: uridine kinase family protein [Marmoricola sp.]
MRAQVIVVAGPSGSGKSRLAGRLGLPVLNLDDFYRSAGDPVLPRLPGGLVDWDSPVSWLYDEAVDALESLCRDGLVDVPEYDISCDGRVGHRLLDLDAADLFVAEGVFAQEVVGECRTRGLLADAICVTQHPQHPAVTFWRRLVRDLRERRKPPLVLVCRGLRLAHGQRAVVAHAVDLGCTPMSTEAAHTRILGLVARASS